MRASLPFTSLSVLSICFYPGKSPGEDSLTPPPLERIPSPPFTQKRQLYTLWWRILPGLAPLNSHLIISLALQLPYTYLGLPGSTGRGVEQGSGKSH